MTADIIWKSIAISPSELSLARVLRCGQTFRWKNVDSVWSFTTQDRIVLLKQDPENLHYTCVLPGDKKPSEQHLESTKSFINDYFNLEVKLGHLYKQWAAVEAKHRPPSKRTSFSSFPGIRILRQDPWETVISFICSSNNNVKRISKMCDALCTEFGTFINTYGDISYHTFPQPETLAKPDTETRLRELGFGYRAKYIHQTAKMFMDNEKYPFITLDGLHKQRMAPYEDACDFLLQLTGVGPKVADCICLMALDKHDCVPVDTHVLQIATRDYNYRGAKTMNKNSYHQVRLHLRDLFGEYAGWAQLVMFAADLSDLNNGVNQKDGAVIAHDVKDVKVEVKEEKKEVKVEEVNFSETRVKRIKV